jgi:hypothetical protein
LVMILSIKTNYGEECCTCQQVIQYWKSKGLPEVDARSKAGSHYLVRPSLRLHCHYYRRGAACNDLTDTCHFFLLVPTRERSEQCWLSNHGHSAREESQRQHAHRSRPQLGPRSRRSRSSRAPHALHQRGVDAV